MSLSRRQVTAHAQQESFGIIRSMCLVDMFTSYCFYMNYGLIFLIHDVRLSKRQIPLYMSAEKAASSTMVSSVVLSQAFYFITWTVKAIYKSAKTGLYINPTFYSIIFLKWKTFKKNLSWEQWKTYLSLFPVCYRNENKATWKRYSKILPHELKLKLNITTVSIDKY